MPSFLKKIARSLFVLFITKGRTPHETTTDEAASSTEKKLLVYLRHPGFFPRASQLFRLHHLLSFKERIATGAALAVLVLGVILFGVSIFPKLGTSESRDGGSYTEALVGSPILINPLWPGPNDVDRDLGRLIFSGLLRRDGAGKLVPDMAERFEISEDQKMYTFFLRKNLSWHDGVPLTAADVAFTINMIQNPVIKSPLAGDFRGITATVENSDTIVFTFESTIPHLLAALTVGLLPEHQWSDVPPESARLAELNVKPIGSGQYRIKSLRKTKQGSIRSYTLEQNPYVYGDRPRLEELTFKLYPDSATAARAVASGNADGLAFIPQELRAGLTRRRDLVYHDLNATQIVGLFFNQKQQTLLGNKEIRTALAHATPRDAILADSFGGYGEPIVGPLLPGTHGFTNEITLFNFSLDRAREILDADGWKLAEGKTVRAFVPKDKKDKRWSAGTELKLTLKTINVPEYARAAELVRDAWTAVGVGVELIAVEPGKMDRDVIAPRAYDVVLYGELMDADGDPYPFWHSSQTASPGVNLAGYSNRRVDALLAEARSLTNPTERGARYTEFSKIVTSEIPAIFLLRPRYLYALDRRVRGTSFGAIATPADRFADIAAWYVKTKLKFGN